MSQTKAWGPSAERTAGELPPTRLWQHLAALLAVTLAVVVVYLNNFNADWTSEGRAVMWEDTGVAAARLKDLRPLLAPAPGSTAVQWERALPRFSYWANRVAFGGSDPFGAHATNIALHWLNGLLLYAAMLAVLRNHWAAFFVAALFGVHPLATDAVSNIAGRPALLGAAAVLGGLLCAMRGGQTRGARRLGWLFLLAACQLFGLASHESAWTLPLVLACYYFLLGPAAPRSASRFRQFAVSFAFVFLPLLGAGVLLWLRWTQQAAALPEMAAAANPLLALDALHARVTALKVLGQSLALMAWPQTLLPDYSYHTIAPVTPASYLAEGWKVVLAALAGASLIVLAFRSARRNQPIVFFILFFFATLLPASNLLWLGRTILLERYLYLPLAAFSGWLVCVVYAVARAVVPWLARYRRRRQAWPAFTARAVLLVLVVGLGARTFARNFDWRDDRTLWSAAVDDGPNNYRAHLRLAVTLLMNEPADLAGALREGERALAIVQEPGWPAPHPPRELLLRLGIAYRQQAESTAPRSEASAVTATPQNIDWYQKSARALEAAAAADRALKAQSATPALPPRLPAIYWNLGLAYMQLSQAAEAAQAFQQLAQDAPANPDAYIRIALARLALAHVVEGTIACWQALILDEKRKEPFEILAQLYKEKGADLCAVSTPGGAVRVNLSCEVLQSYLPAAYRGLIENFLAAGDRTAALRLQAEAVQKYKLAPDTFDQLLPRSPASAP